jgi:hypothetical protein
MGWFSHPNSQREKKKKNIVRVLAFEGGRTTSVARRDGSVTPTIKEKKEQKNCKSFGP